MALPERKDPNLFTVRFFDKVIAEDMPARPDLADRVLSHLDLDPVYPEKKIQWSALVGPVLAIMFVMGLYLINRVSTPSVSSTSPAEVAIRTKPQEKLRNEKSSPFTASPETNQLQISGQAQLKLKGSKDREGKSAIPKNQNPLGKAEAQKPLPSTEHAPPQGNSGSPVNTNPSQADRAENARDPATEPSTNALRVTGMVQIKKALCTTDCLKPAKATVCIFTNPPTCVSTNANGTYSIELPLNGKFQVQVSGSSLLTVTKEVTVENGGKFDFILEEVNPNTPRVEGVIKDDLGIPVTFATVCYYSSGSPPVCGATRPDGTYSFMLPQPRVYQMELTHWYHDTARLDIDVEKAVKKDIVLPRQGAEGIQSQNVLLTTSTTNSELRICFKLVACTSFSNCKAPSQPCYDITANAETTIPNLWTGYYEVRAGFAGQAPHVQQHVMIPLDGLLQIDVPARNAQGVVPPGFRLVTVQILPEGRPLTPLTIHVSPNDNSGERIPDIVTDAQFKAVFQLRSEKSYAIFILENSAVKETLEPQDPELVRFQYMPKGN